MKLTAKTVIEKYLSFSGQRTDGDILKLLNETVRTLADFKSDTKEFKNLSHIKHKLEYGYRIALAEEDRTVIVMIDEKELDFYNATQNAGDAKTKSSKKKRLGKVVDSGDVPGRGRADQYWGQNGMKIAFRPNNPSVRKGQKIPSAYKYADIRFIEQYYNLRGIEFGNWLNQQDRANYLAGLGLALYDLHKVLGFSPKQLSVNGKISVAFGARGKGSSVAHFEPHNFVINITRYSRPDKVKQRPKNFDKIKLLVSGGGIGSFTHEFGHALDYFTGTYLDDINGTAASGGHSTRTTPDMKLMKRKSPVGLMETLLFKIIRTKDNKDYSPYYKRLSKELENEGAGTGYWFRRNEIFARAFEVYAQYKMNQRKAYNVFLQDTKYTSKVYLTMPEMAKLVKDFDKLLKAIKAKIKGT